MTDRERLMLLNLVPDVGSLRMKRLLDAFGSLGDVFAASEERLRQVEGIGPAIAARIVAQCRDRRPLEEELRLAAKAGCTVVTCLDAAYPRPLRTIHDPPPVLYMKGSWAGRDEAAVAIVGARRASIYGQQLAQRFGADLALRGVTVVSGLARGIDAAAHRGALAEGGRTLAVVGNGLASVYPPEHAELAEQVAARGAMISEYPMRLEALPQNFPRRNRLISGLGLGVVVVEAAKRSGALITADCALEQGRDVFATPGQVGSATSEGTHQLLKQGAKFVTTVDDVLEELKLQPLWPAPEPVEASTGAACVADAARTLAPPPPISDTEHRLLGCLSADEPRDIEGLAMQTGFPIVACSSALVRLELKRLVCQLPGQRFLLRSG